MYVSVTQRDSSALHNDDYYGSANKMCLTE